jgi:SWI/SNF-related matrix-associated actin-dependent regulator of chromatin subfamily A3
MSAKRRQETLEAFCVPIEHDTQETLNAQTIPDVLTSELQQTRRSARSTRRGGASGGEYQQADIVPTNGDDDDDFLLDIDFDSDDDADSTRPRSKKRKTKAKGKGKGKGKGKAITRSRITSVGGSNMNTPPISNGVNPKVMLISLKAGALGLNLTVANNIYL